MDDYYMIRGTRYFFDNFERLWRLDKKGVKHLVSFTDCSFKECAKIRDQEEEETLDIMINIMTDLFVEIKEITINDILSHQSVFNITNKVLMDIIINSSDKDRPKAPLKCFNGEILDVTHNGSVVNFSMTKGTSSSMQKESFETRFGDEGKTAIKNFEILRREYEIQEKTSLSDSKRQRLQNQKMQELSIKPLP